jgi:signal transduction histidine kinase
MRLIPRGRVPIALALAMVLGWAYLSWAGGLAVEVWRIVAGNSYDGCAEVHVAPGSYYNICGYKQMSTLFVLLTLAAAVGYGLLLVWVLRQVQGMIAAVTRLGPNNLTERLNPTGSRNDPLVRLSSELDALLDRVAEGYEGQRRFAANASHELRTPLAVQRTLIEVGMAGDPSPDQLELLTRQLLATNERNEALIEGLLVLAETDRGLISRVRLRLDLVAAGAVAIYQSSAEAAGVSITSTLRQVEVDGEEVLLERLVANLLQNAIKYNTSGGTVVVTLGTESTLRVSNTGPVVPAEAIGVIFEPFRRMSGDRLSQGGGSGLGLTIARSITRAHGGTIRAVANLAGGLTVDVDLPPARQPSQPDAVTLRHEPEIPNPSAR